MEMAEANREQKRRNVKLALVHVLLAIGILGAFIYAQMHR